MTFEEHAYRRISLLREAVMPQRVLLVGSEEPINRPLVASLRRALSMLGHQVFVVSAARHPDLIRAEAGFSGRGKELDLLSLTAILATFDPNTVIVAHSRWPLSAASQMWLDDHGIRLILLDSVSGSFPSDVTSSLVGWERGVLGGDDPGVLEVSLPVAVDSSLALNLHARGYPRLANVALLNPEHLRKSYPNVLRDLEAEGKIRNVVSPWHRINDRDLRGSVIHVYPPSSISSRRTQWNCLLSLQGGFLAVLPASLVLPPHLADHKAIYRYGGEHGLEATVTQILSGSQGHDASSHEADSDWESVVFLEDQLNTLLERQAERGVRNGSSTRPTRGAVVAITGWYGEHNLGDELILESLLQGLARVNPGGQSIVAAPRPGSVEREHGVVSAPRHEARSMVEVSHYADCLIVGGGGIWNDKAAAANGGLAGLFHEPKHSVVNLATLPVLFTAVGKPIAGIGLGVGPLSEESGKSLVRLMASMSDVLSVRDRNSLALLEKLGTSGASPRNGGDPAFAWKASDRLPRPLLTSSVRKLRIGVNVRVPDGGDARLISSSWKNLSGSLSAIAKATDCVFVGLPFHHQDVDAIGALFKSMVSAESHLMEFTRDVSQAAADLAECDLVISMRLHASILSHRSGVVAIGLRYEEKIGDYFAEVGEQERVVSPHSSEVAITSLILRTLEGRVQHMERLLPVVDALVESVTENLDSNLSSLIALSSPKKLEFWSV